VTGLQIGIAMFAGMLALMALRVPIAISMFVPGAIAYYVVGGEGPLLNFLRGIAYARLSNYDLSVIPLFLLMGQFATQGGLSRALFAFANALVGHLRGGMAMASVLACGAFGTVCGSSVATCATVTGVALPEMRRHGYSGRLATATLAAGGTMGILIPPSVVLIVYAILAEQNIAKLFAAAMMPAILGIALYVIAIAIYTRLAPEHGPAQPRRSRAELLASATEIWPIVVIFIVVFGGIYGGYFTPTEGAAVGAAATFLAAFLRGEMGFQAFKRSFLGTAETAGFVFMIFLGADMLNGALALTQMPMKLAEFVGGLKMPPLAVIAMIMLAYLVLSSVMDELAMIILTIPILFPLVMELELFGLNSTEKAIWFGILVLSVVEVGLIAPPVGLNVYVVNSLAPDVPMVETYKGVFVFLAADAVRIFFVLFFPTLSLGLMRLIS
jgi:tripartite ATP-independent transporter DctM subunit